MEIKNVRTKSFLISICLIGLGVIICLTSLIMANFDIHAIVSQGPHAWYQIVNYTEEDGYYFGVVTNH